MSLVASTALDLVTLALRDLNVLEAGEVPGPNEASDALMKLNNMLDQWSTEKLSVYSVSEQTFNFKPGQYQYLIGNPIVGTFTGMVTAGSNQITNVTVPANLKVGAMLVDSSANGGGGALPVTTAAVQVTAISGNTLTISQNALITPAGNPEIIAYSTPGDIAYDSRTGATIGLPTRINNAFTRITISGGNPQIQGLDYQIRIIPRDKYTALGLKGIAGPWPTDLYYDRTFPLGNMYFYPNPSMAGECHLWTDTILADYQSINQPINLPQGYAKAVQTNLALELADEYGKTPSSNLVRRAKEAKAAIKSLNALPALEAFFDQHILKSRRSDAGWILHGGFYT